MKVAAEKDLYIIQANHGNMVTNYIPNYLPEDFKEHGLEIEFSGIIGRQATNVVQIGKPFEIKSMTEIKAEAPEPTPVAVDKAAKTQPQKDSTWTLEVDSAGHLQGVVAKVVLLFPEQGLYALETNGGTKRYLPVNLPKEYKKDGLKVKISGITGKIPPNVRLAGTPLRLKRIALVE